VVGKEERETHRYSEDDFGWPSSLSAGGASFGGGVKVSGRLETVDDMDEANTGRRCRTSAGHFGSTQKAGLTIRVT
jgi:hypothetical protein